MSWSDRFRSTMWLESTDGSPKRLRPVAVYPLLAIVVVSFGVNWPVMATGLESISALWMSSFRLIGACATTALIALFTGRLARPARGDYPILLSVAVRLALVFVFVFSALEIVPPGRSAILVWRASLWTVPLAVIFVGERMSSTRWAGVVIGIAGILFVFEPTRLDWGDGRVLLGRKAPCGGTSCPRPGSSTGIGTGCPESPSRPMRAPTRTGGRSPLEERSLGTTIGSIG